MIFNSFERGVCSSVDCKLIKIVHATADSRRLTSFFTSSKIDGGGGGANIFISKKRASSVTRTKRYNNPLPLSPPPSNMQTLTSNIKFEELAQKKIVAIFTQGPPDRKQDTILGKKKGLTGGAFYPIILVFSRRATNERWPSRNEVTTRRRDCQDRGDVEQHPRQWHEDDGVDEGDRCTWLQQQQEAHSDHLLPRSSRHGFEGEGEGGKAESLKLLIVAKRAPDILIRSTQWMLECI